MSTRITKRQLLELRKQGHQALVDYEWTICRIIDANRGTPCVNHPTLGAVWIISNTAPIFTRKMA